MNVLIGHRRVSSSCYHDSSKNSCLFICQLPKTLALGHIPYARDPQASRIVPTVVP